MKTVIHQYRFNTSNPDEAAAWDALVADRKANGVPLFAAISTSKKCPLDGDIELETAHIFSNQWNTKDWRVFDFYQGIVPNDNIKAGHWLEITKEMREIRRNTNVCGYCGHQESAARGLVFCDCCIGSEYLKEDDLHLLRMLPAGDHLPQRNPLTNAEREHLLPQYLDAQIRGNTARDKARIAKARERIESKFTATTNAAKTERDGFLWLMDHGHNTSNVIYYSHTNRFCFGWRKAIGDSEYSRLADLLCEFPFDYDVTRA